MPPRHHPPMLDNSTGTAASAMTMAIFSGMVAGGPASAAGVRVIVLLYVIPMHTVIIVTAWTMRGRGDNGERHERVGDRALAGNADASPVTLTSVSILTHMSSVTQ